MLRPSFGNRLTAAWWAPAAATGALPLRYARGPQSCPPVRQQPGTGESPSRWSGRYWTVRASAPQDEGLDRRPGIPGVGGTRITPVGRLPPRLPGSSSRAWRCSLSSGDAPPPSGSRRPGCGTGVPGSGRNRSAWRPGTPPPSGFARVGWVNPAGASPPREARHFSQRGCHAAAALIRSRARGRATSSLRGISPRFRAALAAFR